MGSRWGRKIVLEGTNGWGFSPYDGQDAEKESTGKVKGHATISAPNTLVLWLNLGVHSFSRTKISWVDQLCKCSHNHAQWCTYETHRHLSIYAVDSQDKASGMSTIVHSEQWEEREGDRKSRTRSRKEQKSEEERRKEQRRKGVDWESQLRREMVQQ